jgi:hypothetical protein
MMSSHLLTSTMHVHRSAYRMLLELAAVVILMAFCASQAHGIVSRAESGDHVKPMSPAQYAVIKQRIRSQRLYHVQPREWIHWTPNTTSGWVSPWPK